MTACQQRKKMVSRQSARWSRRTFFGRIASGTLVGSVLGCGLGANIDSFRQDKIYVQSPLRGSVRSLGMPGPFPGRVVEVGHTGSVIDGQRDRTAVKAMIEQGMRQLVSDAESSVDAWRYFFQKGDRIGIKVVPVGKVAKRGYHAPDSPCVDLKRPGPISSYEIIQEVVDALASAGIRPSDIMVFDRYLDEFIQAGYKAILPDGVHWECSSTQYDPQQLEIDGQIRGEPHQKHVAGYDRDVFRELAFCQPADVHDPLDDRRFRSHLSKIVTQKVDKIISIPVLKDHRSAGVTLALKNMSHGFVNNVARSHVVEGPFQDESYRTMNHCQTFIPAAVSLPPTREKCVLQILDGLVGNYEGGPGEWNKTFATWEYKSLLFATDPVALDHVGWKIIDDKRQEEGWPVVARMGREAQAGLKDGVTEMFHIRQPQHIPLAALLELGAFERRDIKHQRFEIG